MGQKIEYILELKPQKSPLAYGKRVLKIMFITLPLTCMNFRAVELFVSISDVQDIIGGYLYDIFALDHTYETTLIRTHQAQNGAFSFFNTFFC